MFKIGDVVTRNSYGNDIVFEIIDMNGNNCVLKGIDFRLYADSNVEDLKLFLDKREDSFFPLIETVDKLDRSEYFYLPGKILHIDADHLCNSEFEEVL